MDERKIIGFGKDSYVVSVPKRWISANKLKKGDSLFMKTDPFEIVLTPSRLPEEQVQKSITIEATNRPVARLKSEIMTAYLNNYSIIEVRGEMKMLDRETIKDFINYLAGLEIFEISPKSIVAKDIIDFEQVPITMFIKRVDMNIRSMLKALMEAIDGKNTYEDIFARDLDVNRLIFLAYRMIKRSLTQPALLAKTNLGLLDIYSISRVLTRLEKIGDQAKRTARRCVKSRLQPSMQHQLHRAFLEIVNLYGAVMKAYYNNDLDASFDIGIKCSDCMHGLIEMQKKARNVEVALIIEQLKSMLSAIRHISQNVPGST